MGTSRPDLGARVNFKQTADIMPGNCERGHPDHKYQSNYQALSEFLKEFHYFPLINLQA
jgi:hypothetical protein